jgi:hypothetical protein
VCELSSQASLPPIENLPIEFSAELGGDTTANEEFEMTREPGPRLQNEVAGVAHRGYGPVGGHSVDTSIVKRKFAPWRCRKKRGVATQSEESPMMMLARVVAFAKVFGETGGNQALIEELHSIHVSCCGRSDWPIEVSAAFLKRTVQEISAAVAGDDGHQFSAAFEKRGAQSVSSGGVAQSSAACESVLDSSSDE